MEQDVGLGVVQAAARLGISVDAVRKRIRRRTLRAYKVDGEWRIILDAPSPPDQPNGLDAIQGGPASIVQDDDRVSRLKGEIQFLRQLTEHQAGVIAQLSATVADLTRRVPELPAGGRHDRGDQRDADQPEPPAEPPAKAPQTPVAPRRAWGWLRRLLGR
jgi:excisionase family DNA binding protein